MTRSSQRRSCSSLCQFRVVLKTLSGCSLSLCFLSDYFYHNEFCTEYYHYFSQISTKRFHL